MTTKLPCSIEFSDSGHFMRLIHKSGFVVGEFIISDTNLMNKSLAGYDRFGKLDINYKFRNPDNIYHGRIDEMVLPEEVNEEIENLNDMLEEYKKYQTYVELEMKEEEGIEDVKF